MRPFGKFKIDTDICMAVVNNKCLSSCNGTIELNESETVSVISTDVYHSLLSGTNWELESAINMMDTLWKISLKRGDDRLDAIVEQIIEETDFKFM